MNTRLKLIFIFSTVLLHLAAGCSNSGKNDEPDPSPAEARNSVVIYEANPKVFAKTNALQSITGRLDEIKELGTDVLWLMPIYEQGQKNSVGSPYCVKNYEKVNAEFGNLQDLKNLVNAAHSKGMRVILDWIANHTAWDNAWTTEHKDWYTQNGKGEIISPEGMGWPDVADLNYNSQSLRTAMIDAMKYWINEVDVDGFRCDYAEGVPEDFWSKAINELKKIKGEELFMLAEGNKSSLYNAGFDAVYSWNFVYTAEKVWAGSNSLSDLYSFQNSDLAGVPDGAYRMRYITNHDMTANEHTPVSAFKSKDGAMAAFVLTAMMSDCVMIYSSQEIGYGKTLSFFNYNILNWDDDKAYTAGYKKFMTAYKGIDPYRTAKPVLYQSGKGAAVWAGGEKGALAVINPTGSDLQLKVPMEQAGKTAEEMSSGEKVTIPQALTLKPYEYKIYIVK